MIATPRLDLPHPPEPSKSKGILTLQVLGCVILAVILTAGAFWIAQFL